MKLIGLTGPTGSGKTLLTAVARAIGIETINADTVAKAIASESEVNSALIEAFGESILSDGEIDRKKLAHEAFSSEEKTELLNKTMLPFIVEQIRDMIGGSNARFILVDAPTLFESGLDAECDYILSVIADEATRKARIIERDGISEQAANERLAAAKPDEFFISRSTHVIFNNGDKEAYIKQATEVLSSIITDKEN